MAIRRDTREVRRTGVDRVVSGPMTGVTAEIIPAAGLGTRFLPATKAMPKEMLPIVDKPAIQFVVEEAVAAGLNDLLFITSRGKRALEDHFDQNIELEAACGEERQRAARARAESNDLAHIHYVRQGQALGLGHAVLMADITSVINHSPSCSVMT